MILLDTHIVTWLTFAPEQLSKRAKEAIRTARAEGGLAIAANQKVRACFGLLVKERFGVIPKLPPQPWREIQRMRNRLPVVRCTPTLLVRSATPVVP